MDSSGLVRPPFTSLIDWNKMTLKEKKIDMFLYETYELYKCDAYRDQLFIAAYKKYEHEHGANLYVDLQ